MIESLIQDRGLKAVKVAGTHGGEWACPCPACGGKDRFRFWPAQGEGGTWYCRQCDKGGDSIQFLREFEGLSYTEACRRLGVERAAAPTSIMPRADKEGAFPHACRSRPGLAGARRQAAGLCPCQAAG